MNSPIEYEHSGRLLNEQEAADFLAMSKAWLRKRRSQKLPPHHIYLGASVRYPIRKLNEFVESLAVPTNKGSE